MPLNIFVIINVLCKFLNCFIMLWHNFKKCMFFVVLNVLLFIYLFILLRFIAGANTKTTNRNGVQGLVGVL